MAIDIGQIIVDALNDHMTKLVQRIAAIDRTIASLQGAQDERDRLQADLDAIGAEVEAVKLAKKAK